MTKRAMTIEEQCEDLRKRIEDLKVYVVAVTKDFEFQNEDMFLKGPNMPESRQENMKANLTLVFRCLEDARMRLGKVMQAYQGGISLLDNYNKDEEGKVK